MKEGMVTLKTKSLILRKFKENDVNDFYNNWANDSEVTKYLTWPTHENIEITKLVLKSFINDYDKGIYNWAIVLDNEVIGNISTVSMDKLNLTCEIGYVIGRKYWNQGYTTEALKAVIDYLFKEGFKKIVAKHDINNPSSGRVMEKAGMKYLKTEYQMNKNNQGIVDCKVYEIER